MSASLVDALDQTWSATSALLHGLAPAQWDAPTGCPDWTVHDVTSHLVWSARMLGGQPVAPGDVALPDLPRLSSPIAQYMERDVVARRERPHDQVLAELDEHRRRAIDQLRAAARGGRDASFTGPMAAEMTYESYLPIAVLDEWVHGEDIRRAVGAPMEDHTAAFTHSIGQLLHVLAARPFVPCELVLGAPVDRTVPLGDGPARSRITLGVRDFVARATGRDVPLVAPTVEGDSVAADAVLRSFVVTP